MKKLLIYLLLGIVFAGGGNLLHAQSGQLKFKPRYLREDNRAFQQLTYYASDNGWLEFRQDIAPIEADKFFSKYANDLGIKNDYQFRSIKDKTDRGRNRHQNYQLYYRGVLVEGVMYALHSRNGLLTTAQGRIPDDLTLDVSKPMQEKLALDIALADRKLTLDDFKENIKLPKGELVVTSIDGDLIGLSFRLAYYFDFSGKQPADFVRVYVDANSGAVLKREPLLDACFGHTHTEQCNHNPVVEQTATSANAVAAPKIAGTFTPVNYSNNRYLPAGQTTRTFEVDPFGNGGSQLTARTTILQALDTRNDNNGDLQFNDPALPNGTINWGTNQQTATTTHWIAYQSYQYFRNVLDPFNDNNGTDGQGRIANILLMQPQIEGAFWDPAQRLMLVGRNLANGRVLSTIDIVGHEYGHGMSRRLIGGDWTNVGREARALNEGFSDIIGTAVERHLLPDGTPQQWNWTLGEDAWLVRNMANPGQFNMPQWFEGPGWDTQGVQPVHHNSAVLSRWFHALVTGNSPRANFPVNGISFDDAMKVVYKGLDSYIMPNATYADVSNAMRLAARDEFGGCSPQQRSVITAWNAVNLPFNLPCDPTYCNKDLSVVAPSSANCGQTVTITSTCSTPNANNVGCSPNVNSFDFYNQSGSYLGSGSSFNLVMPLTTTTAQYTVKLLGGLYCFVPTRAVNINVSCNTPPTPSCSVPTNACYTIQVQKTGQLLQAMGDGNVFQQGASGQNNQIWKVDDRGNGRVSFTVQDGSNKAIRAGSGNPGESLTVDSYVGNGQQDWALGCNPADNTLWRVFYPNNNNNTWDLKDFGNQPNLQIWGSTSEPFYDYRSFRFQPVTCPNTNTPPTTGNLSFQTVGYDCNTGVWQWQYTGGNGSQIETWCPGAFGNRLISANSIQSVTLDANLRNGTNFNISALQAGQTFTYTFTSSCNGTTPPPTGGGFTIIAPTFNCSTGDLTVNTTGGNGSAIEYQIPGLRGWGSSPTMNVPSWQRNGTSFTLQARQSGVESAPYSFLTNCGSGRLAARAIA